MASNPAPPADLVPDLVDVDDLSAEAMLVAGVDRFDSGAVFAGGDGGDVFGVEFVEELTRRASAAVEALMLLDASYLSKDVLTVLAVGTERVRRQVDAVGVRIAGHVDDKNPFLTDGFFTAKSWLKHRLQLSGPEAYRRVQAARMHDKLPLWHNAASAGVVGVAQSELIARLAANPRIDPELLHAGAWELFADALDLPFKAFQDNVARWEKLADRDGAEDQAESNWANRDADIKSQPNGSWHLTADFDDIGGAEFTEIFAQYVDAEWQADWAEARKRVGDTATMADLRRSQAQRRADALLAMARAAATCPPWSKRPLPTLNILIDHETFESELKGERIDPARYRDVVCRTQSGHELNTSDAAKTALIAHVRRVVYDSDGVVIDLGRRRRLFTGSSREAAMLLATECDWTGCDTKGEWCQVDHAIAWKAHGPTVPRNARPCCGRHNRLKERGYKVTRGNDGQWHTYHPDGYEIL